MNLFYNENDFYLPKEFMGKEQKNGGFTKTNPRKWTQKEIDWMLDLKNKGMKTESIAKYLYRNKTSVSIKLKRVSKKQDSYNSKHRAEKYKMNNEFLKQLDFSSVLDMFSGKESFYKGKCKTLITNDENIDFDCVYNEKAELLIHKLYYDRKRFDLIDLDPFGSAFDCFDLAIKMAKKALIITFGEIGHKRWKRLDFVKHRYNINTIEEFTTSKLVEEVQKIGLRNKKKLIPIFVCDWKNISRVYFKIEKIKIIEQWQ